MNWINKSTIKYVALAFVLISAWYVFKDTTVKFLEENKLLPMEEIFTELYFTDHLKLPKTVEQNETKEFSFTIHNLENNTILYEYEVYAQLEDNIAESTESSKAEEVDSLEEDKEQEKILLDVGTISLLNDKYRTINVKFKLPEVKDRNKIVVNLKHKDQSIHFWMDGK